MVRRMFLALVLGACGLATCGGCEPTRAADPRTMSTAVEDWDVGRKILIFTTEDCSVCRREHPKWQKLREQVRPKRIAVVEIDADQHPEIAQRFNVQSYPTYVLVEDGKAMGWAQNLKRLLFILKIVWFVVVFIV